MKSAAERLYELLPAIYRVRDAENGKPLKALISVIAAQMEVIEEDLAQLYDDQFIETCAPWVAPYIGDLIGYRPLHGIVPKISSPRAEVANTIGYRRRKGTVTMLEQLAHDVTGWSSRVVEFFQRLATTQYMNHARPENRSLDLRSWESLERANTPFDSLVHTADVRRIEPGRGRYNIPNVGIFLWRLNSYPLTVVQPRQLDARRFFFSPLGNNTPLFTLPKPRDEFSGISTRMDVPDPITRRTFHSDLTDKGSRLLDRERSDYYGAGRSILITVGGEEESEVVACDLSDVEDGAWAHQPKEKIAIDPALGRIAFPSEDSPPQDVRVTFHYGFSADLGGGEYDRTGSVPEAFTRKTKSDPSLESIWQIGVSNRIAPVKNTIVSTLVEAVQAWNWQSVAKIGVISIMDSGSYEAGLVGVNAIDVSAGKQLLIIAADWPKTGGGPDGQGVRVPGVFQAEKYRPHLRGNIEARGAGLAGADTEAGQIFFNGVLVEGFVEVSTGRLERLSVQHSTLVPGRGLSSDGSPKSPGEPSLIVSTQETRLEIGNSIIGGLRVAENMEAHITNSIVDATSPAGVAFAALDGHAAGGALHIENATVIGKVHTNEIRRASNTIFMAESPDGSAPIRAKKRQAGCVRFSYLPLDSVTPRRYQCQPQSEETVHVRPSFTSLSYGNPGYAQLSQRCPKEIFSGADDESEMGAFHDLYQPQRIANIRMRLDEYLRFGLEAGIICAT